jgi:phosphate/sulfate permease
MEYYHLVFRITHEFFSSLIGGIIGAALVKAGPKSLVLSGIFRTVTFIFISPVLGLILGPEIGVAAYRHITFAPRHKLDKSDSPGHNFKAK